MHMVIIILAKEMCIFLGLELIAFNAIKPIGSRIIFVTIYRVYSHEKVHVADQTRQNKNKTKIEESNIKKRNLNDGSKKFNLGNSFVELFLMFLVADTRL